MKKLFCLLTMLLLVLVGCGSTDEILVTGSTSVEAYFTETIIPAAEEELGYTISYESVGSTAGITAAQNGTTDFGTASREVTNDELSQEIQAEAIAYDGIAIVVNPENPVTNLSIEQINQIYTGEITNWSDVGGNDQEITVVSREDGSGTKTSFEELIGIDNNLTADAIFKEGNGNVASTVASNSSAIGYISFTTLYDNTDNVKSLTVDEIEPTAPNINDDLYPLYRPFNLVYNPDDLTTADQEFLDWLQTNTSTLAPEAGLVAIS